MSEPDRQERLTALTTEHFTLQGARSQTVSESASRATLYVMAVSSALVGLGFIGQVSEVGDVFDIFAMTVLPTLYVLGLFTLCAWWKAASKMSSTDEQSIASATITSSWPGTRRGCSCSPGTTTRPECSPAWGCARPACDSTSQRRR